MEGEVVDEVAVDVVATARLAAAADDVEAYEDPPRRVRKVVEPESAVALFFDRFGLLWPG